MNPDLRHATYEEIVDFVFNHYPEDEVDDKWYWNELDDDIQIEPVQAISFITRLCNACGELVEQFTLRQIAEGVTFLFGARAQFEFQQQLWNPDVSWPDRLACIRSIPNLYTQVFERDPDGIGGCAFMLWDSIAYDYCCGNRHPATNAEDARVQDAMFDALVSMFRSEHPETLRGAIHGLGHLEHRDGIVRFASCCRRRANSTLQCGPMLRKYSKATSNRVLASPSALRPAA